MSNDDKAAIEKLHETYKQMKAEVGQVIVGQEEVVEQTLMADPLAIPDEATTKAAD